MLWRQDVWRTRQRTGWWLTLVKQDVSNDRYSSSTSPSDSTEALAPHHAPIGAEGVTVISTESRQASNKDSTVPECRAQAI
jgi:hypothetical protein